MGDHRWDYRIEFAEDFAGIVGGEIVSHSASGSSSKPFRAPWSYDWEPSLSYLRWSEPPSTIFGSVYVQGAVYSPVLEGVASYHFESKEQCYISYGNSPESWRLDDGSRPPSRKPFEQISYDESTRTFRGRVSWAEPFDGAVRWDYTIVFSEARKSLSCSFFLFFQPVLSVLVTKMVAKCTFKLVLLTGSPALRTMLSLKPWSDRTLATSKPAGCSPTAP